MNLIDTHCHLYLPEFAQDIEAVMHRADEEGVMKFYLPAIDSATMPDLLNLEAKFPGKCCAMAGLHPCSVKEDFRSELKKVEESLGKRAFAGIGETGLDFYWDRSFEKEQYDSFQQQIEWAIHYRIPIIIHSRDSLDQTIRMIKENQKGNLRGIFHCFSGSAESAAQIIDLGFHMGIGGVITYKKAGVAELTSRIDLRHLLLETDAPYLTPAPFRGKRNESSYLKYVVAKLAAVKGTSMEEVARVTTANGEHLFKS
jgi:TatD DNase family protein